MKHWVLHSFLALSLLIVGCMEVMAAPVQSFSNSQKVVIRAQRIKGTGAVLKVPLKVGVAPTSLEWEYIPGTSASVPFIGLQLQQIPLNGKVTVLAARSGKLTPDPKLGFVMRFPLLKKESRVIFTLIDDQGQFEEWEVQVTLSFLESAIYVDESCRDYFLKIKELKRPLGPNLMYVGCRMGARPQDLSLDIMWGDIERIEYMSNILVVDNSVVTIPLESRRQSEARLIGIHERGARSMYQIEYRPYVPPPYEAWAGLAFFRSSFEQSNFSSKYSGVSTAFLGQFWYRAEDVPFSLMVRGFGTLLSFSNNLTPEKKWKESVKTYFLDGEMRYRVLDRSGWRIDPFLGGWFFFMNVASRQFGIQRIIDPVIGAVVQRNVGKRDTVGLTVRFVPLQSFLNPFKFRLDQSYLEFELNYVHPFQKRNRFFTTLYYGNLNYTPENSAKTNGSYLVIGGGYGW